MERVISTVFLFLSFALGAYFGYTKEVKHLRGNIKGIQQLPVTDSVKLGLIYKFIKL